MTRTDTPSENGLYACKTPIGWRIMEWHKNRWYFPDRVAPLMLAVFGWVGPLKDPVMEFDL